MRLEARQACTEALRLMEESEGPDSPDAVNLLNDLADIEAEHQNFARALALAKRGQAITGHLCDGFSGEGDARIRLKTLELPGTIRPTLGD